MTLSAPAKFTVETKFLTQYCPLDRSPADILALVTEEIILHSLPGSFPGLRVPIIAKYSHDIASMCGEW